MSQILPPGHTEASLRAAVQERAEMDADTRGELTDRAEPVDGQRVSR